MTAAGGARGGSRGTAGGTQYRGPRDVFYNREICDSKKRMAIKGRALIGQRVWTNEKPRSVSIGRAEGGGLYLPVREKVQGTTTSA